MAKKKPCKHFEYCGAHIIRGHLGEAWEIKFCRSGNSEICVHFEDGAAKKKIFEKFKKTATS